MPRIFETDLTMFSLRIVDNFDRSSCFLQLSRKSNVDEENFGHPVGRTTPSHSYIMVFVNRFTVDQVHLEYC